MAGITIAFCGAQHLFRLVAQHFAGAMIIEPGIGGLEPDGDTPRTDGPKQFQNGYQTGYRPKCLVKTVARKSILTLIRNGKNLALLLPTICRGSEVAGG
jgi:hypothetical protein